MQSHPQARTKIRETHPEVCFRALAGKPIIHPKKREEGFRERLTILSKYLPGAEQVISGTLACFKRKEVMPDDILDSMVAAITACFEKKRQVCLPKNAEFDKAGRAMEIVYPEAS